MAGYSFFSSRETPGVALRQFIDCVLAPSTKSESPLLSKKTWRLQFINRRYALDDENFQDSYAYHAYDRSLLQRFLTDMLAANARQ